MEARKTKAQVECGVSLFEQGSGERRVGFLTAKLPLGRSVCLSFICQRCQGQLQMQRIKQLENENDLSLKTNSIAQKARVLEQQERIVRDQRDKSMANANYYKQLWEAEQQRLAMGESSVFMVNQRENTWIDQRLKALDYEQKWMQTKAEISQLLFKPYF